MTLHVDKTWFQRLVPDIIYAQAFLKAVFLFPNILLRHVFKIYITIQFRNGGWIKLKFTSLSLVFQSCRNHKKHDNEAVCSQIPFTMCKLSWLESYPVSLAQ